MTASKDTIEKLSRAIMESPIRLMNPDEIACGDKLSEGEFMSRAKAFINDPESGIPGGRESEAVTIALLAKNLRRRLPSGVAERLMAPAYGSTVAEPSITEPVPQKASKQVSKKTVKKVTKKKTAKKTAKKKASKKSAKKKAS